MAELSKVPVQAFPAAGVLQDLFTVPDGKHAVMNLQVCNQAAEPSTFYVAVAPGGEADASKHYLLYREKISGESGYQIVIGITGGAGTVVRVKSTNGRMSFNLSRREGDV